MSIDLDTGTSANSTTICSSATGPRPATRIGSPGRWTLAGAGLAKVWRYGDLDLDAPSGRLLLRGANGTGKTTALEALRRTCWT